MIQQYDRLMMIQAMEYTLRRIRIVRIAESTYSAWSVLQLTDDATVTNGCCSVEQVQEKEVVLKASNSD